MSRTRERASRKADTPEKIWNRLTPLQQRTLLVIGVEEPIGVPYHAIQGLIDWWCVVPRKSGYVLSVQGAQVRDYGRSVTQ